MVPRLVHFKKNSTVISANFNSSKKLLKITVNNFLRIYCDCEVAGLIPVENEGYFSYDYKIYIHIYTLV